MFLWMPSVCSRSLARIFPVPVFMSDWTSRPSSSIRNYPVLLLSPWRRNPSALRQEQPATPHKINLSPVFVFVDTQERYRRYRRPSLHSAALHRHSLLYKEFFLLSSSKRAQQNNMQLFIFIPKFLCFPFNGVRRTLDCWQFFLSSLWSSFCFVFFFFRYFRNHQIRPDISFSALPRCQRSRRIFFQFWKTGRYDAQKYKKNHKIKRIWNVGNFSDRKRQSFAYFPPPFFFL